MTQMTHNLTVTPELFAALQKRQRHLFVKHNPLHMPGDLAAINAQDDRTQIEMEIISVTKENINQKGGLSLLGVYAPYSTENDIQGAI